jgi:hypothetical protein
MAVTAGILTILLVTALVGAWILSLGAALERERWARHVTNLNSAARMLEDGQVPEEFRQGWEWDHLNLRRDLSLVTLGNHPGPVRVSPYSPDGKYFATVSEGELRIWTHFRTSAFISCAVQQ